MLKKSEKDLSLSECPEGPKAITFDPAALLEKIDRLEAEVEELRERDRLREEELRKLRERTDGMRRGLRYLLDRAEREAAPGRETKDRINALLSELMRNGNRPIELASFDFGDGKLNRQQRTRLVAHLRQDPLFEVPERPAGRKLFVHLAGKPVRPR